jgi:hypothetical protein
VTEENQELHLFCLRWAEWHRSRRLFAPPVPANILARMRGPAGGGEVPDALLSANLSYFNLSVLAQKESQSKFIFYLFYLHRAKNIKAVAHEMGFSTSYFYRQLRTFRAEAHRAYRAMMEGQPVAEREEENELQHA